MIDVYKDNQFVRHLEPFELEKAKRDISFFYEEQKQWATISGQLSFGYTFNLPYWDYLDLRGEIDHDEKDLVRKGSLLLLLSECLEFFEDLGTYYLIDNEKLASVKDSVRTFDTLNTREKDIKHFILALTVKIETEDNKWEKTWEEFLNRLFVMDVYGYFRNKVRSFDNHWETLYLKYEEK
jgi:hypothetical protein